MEANNTYGQKILTICKSLEATSITKEELLNYFPAVVDEEKNTGSASQNTVVQTKPEDNTKTDRDEKTELNNNKADEADKKDKIEESADNLAILVFNIIKKLVKMFADLFNNKGE